MGAGSFSVGGVVSHTVTGNDDGGEALPCRSVAPHVTVVVPSGKNEPEGGRHLTGTETSTMSLAQVAKVTGAPVGPVAGTVMSGSSHSAGAVVSRTRTTKVAVVVWPLRSVAEQDTVVSTSSRKSAGAPGGAAGKQETGTLPSTTSLAVTS